MFNLIFQRLATQGLTQPTFSQPEQVVGWLGAVQSQDYAGALWAVGQRLNSFVGESALEQAFNEGKFLRTHVLRPTWHFVLPADIRWMLDLTAPRVHAISAYNYRQVGLDSATFARANDVIAQALQGGVQLTRAELGTVLQAAELDTSDLKLAFMTAHAELDGVICSGARKGKWHTYALIDDRAPDAERLTRDEALTELALRYFISHGFATLEDYAWWSGLTVTDARAGLESIKSSLISEVIDGKTYWRADSAFAETTAVTQSPSAPVVHLLPNYDEYTVAFTERSALYDPSFADQLDSRGDVIFNYAVFIDGRVVGTWKRSIRKQSVTVERTLFRALTLAEDAAVTAAAERYAAYLGLPLA